MLGGAGEVQSKVKHLMETEEPGTQLTPETFHILPHTSVQERWSKILSVRQHQLQQLEKIREG